MAASKVGCTLISSATSPASIFGAAACSFATCFLTSSASISCCVMAACRSDSVSSRVASTNCASVTSSRSVAWYSLNLTSENSPLTVLREDAQRVRWRTGESLGVQATMAQLASAAPGTVPASSFSRTSARHGMASSRSALMAPKSSASEAPSGTVPPSFRHSALGSATTFTARTFPSTAPRTAARSASSTDRAAWVPPIGIILATSAARGGRRGAAGAGRRPACPSPLAAATAAPRTRCARQA
mmetsp:Transcript_60480/g.155879  ORF Transcript_60480/g.155879 Transcript_60480/m.155879 type:complete len:244 (-) Transcript_60480:3-734(-)